MLNFIPNFTKINELPSYKDCQINNETTNFVSEEVNIKELDYFFTNSISRASKTMSECRQIKLSSKKLGQIIYDRVFRNFSSRNLQDYFFTCPNSCICSYDCLAR